MAIFSRTNVRALGLIIGVLFAGFVAIQFYRPQLTNPPVLADFQAPPTVKQIFVTSCYDCHSNQSKIPWFDQPAPAYWLVVRDIKRGRMHLNFSNFGKQSPASQKAVLYEAVNMIRLGAMPPRRYTLIHPNAVVSAAQISTLQNYLHPAETNHIADSAQIDASAAEYQKWLAGDGTKLAQNVAPAANGLAFLPDYKNWQLLSNTDRFDNGTLRIILGNDVAIKAVAAQQTHPWPNGAAFAKISMLQQLDDTGIAKAGHFVQVEFMVKDASKYAATQGWGFGRWKGDNLAPYGKNKAFANECTSCHTPMAENDHVYTMPIRAEPAPSDVFNGVAALPDGLPYPAFQWKVITSWVDKTNATMSTLFGNDIAVTHARTSPQSPYPAGAVLAVVTWHQQEDKHWLGARITGKVQSVEFITAAAPANDVPNYSYQKYEGDPLKKTTTIESTDLQASSDALIRLGSIVAERAAALP
jgi:mono/diheme cytochrome c family protein